MTNTTDEINKLRIHGPHISRKLRCYLLLLAIVLPMDWFSWTGVLFREAGARPAIPLMTAASFYLFFAKPRWLSSNLPKEIYRVLLVLALIALCGISAFVLNLIFSWSYFGGSKDPIFQALAQSALFFLAAFILVAHSALLRDRAAQDIFIKYLPIAAGFHLFCMLLEAAGLLQPTHFPLSVFRLTNGQAIGAGSYRIAGLFSEPSYFGTMAALYGLPLLLINTNSKGARRLNISLAFLLFISAFQLGAKTVIPVAVCGYAAFLWQTGSTIFTPTRIIALIVAAAGSLFLVISTATLDVQDNLSTAMRFGSTLTALNVAKAGYGITGLGFGQFHFMFKPAFAPDFLFLSQEATDLMHPGAEHRASTYNLFARYLVETGVTGFILWLYLLGIFAGLARAVHSKGMTLGALLMGTALGFLLTQDPYCFPPLILGMAFILASYCDSNKLTLATVSHK